MSFVVGRTEADRRSWPRKSVIALAVAALLSGGIISAPAAIAAPGSGTISASIGVAASQTASSKTSAAKKHSAASLKPEKAVKISGTAKYGSTLKVATKWPSGAKAKYQWYRGSSKIKGATKASYKVVKTDIGKIMKVAITVTKLGYAKYNASAKSAKIGKASFSIKTAPKISGTKKAGHRLKVSTGTLSPRPSSYSYQWYRGTAKIKGATKSSYKLSKSDIGKKISARVTVRRSYVSTKTFPSAAIAIPATPKAAEAAARKAAAEKEAAEKKAAEAKKAREKAEAERKAEEDAARKKAQEEAEANAPAAPPPAPLAYYKNCTAAKAAGAAPVHRGDPGYGSHLDRDGDGVACES
jgi:hypothetical protein